MQESNIFSITFNHFVPILNLFPSLSLFHAYSFFLLRETEWMSAANKKASSRLNKPTECSCNTSKKIKKERTKSICIIVLCVLKEILA